MGGHSIIDSPEKPSQLSVDDLNLIYAAGTWRPEGRTQDRHKKHVLQVVDGDQASWGILDDLQVNWQYSG